MAYEEFLAGRYGGMQPVVYTNGIKQDEQSMAASSGFVGTNNMGQSINTPTKPITPSFATPNPAIQPNPTMKATLGSGLKAPQDQNFINWLKAQNVTAPTALFGQPQGQLARSGSILSDSTGSMRVL